MSVENIQIGACQATFGDVDLGLTQGGITLSIRFSAERASEIGYHEQYDYIAKNTEISVLCPLAESKLDTIRAILPWSKESNGVLSVADISGSSLRPYASTLLLTPLDTSADKIRLPMAIPIIDTSTAITFSRERLINVSFVAICKSATDRTLIEFIEQ